MRCNKLTCFSLFSVVLLVAGVASAQDKQLLVLAAKLMQEENRNYTDEIVNKDIDVIVKNYDFISSKLKERDIVQKGASDLTQLVNWKQLRLKTAKFPIKEPLTDSVWIASFNELETCRIESLPDQGASVSIDGTPQTGTTDMLVGLRGNNVYKIRLKKDTKSAEGDLKVSKGGANTYTGTLK